MSRIPHRTQVSYIDRTREYYAAQGYEAPYAWASHSDVPFAPLPRPLSECRVALVTIASPWHEDPAHRPRAFTRQPVWFAPSSPPPDVTFTDNLAWDKESTHTRDVESFLPLNHLAQAARDGRIGSVSPRFYGVPTEYSQGRTQREDAPAVLAMCREDQVDVALIAAL